MDIIEMLKSHQKLERDRGIEKLESVLAACQPELMDLFKKEFVFLLENDTLPWEQRHGALVAMKLIISKTTENEFWTSVRDHALHLLEHDEVRVRVAAGELLGELCRVGGKELFATFIDLLTNSIQQNLAQHNDQAIIEELRQKLNVHVADQKEAISKAESLFVEAAGWKHLETSVKALHFCIESCNAFCSQLQSSSFIDLVSTLLQHGNRFVRETAFYLLASLVHGLVDVPPEQHVLLQRSTEFAHLVAMGLADSWSEVRLAASVAARRFLSETIPKEQRDAFFPVMLPPMCLNRYYAAEGVKLYSQETWRLVTENHGRELVEQYFDSVVSFYIQEILAPNYSVREAVCACIAELGDKCQSSLVDPYLPSLFDALTQRMTDPAWPVRDASCLALSRLIAAYPEQLRPLVLPLWPSLFSQLGDPVASVREATAASLAVIGSSLGPECVQMLTHDVLSAFSALNGAPHAHKEEPAAPPGPPARQPWALVDGCLYLLSEMAQLPSCKAPVVSLIPAVADAARLDHYDHWPVVLETLCRHIPTLATGLGKNEFKRHLELLFPAIFKALRSLEPMTQSAAESCIFQLADLIGRGILKGRVELYDTRLVPELERVLSQPPRVVTRIPMFMGRPQVT